MEGPWEVTRPLAHPAGVPEPGPRMGHTTTYLPTTQRLVVVGGSDGSDLLRNGRELLQEVFFLRLGDHNNNTTMRWSLPSAVHPLAPTGQERTFTGRTHTAHLINDNQILLFGGNCQLSDAVGLLRVNPQANAVGFHPLDRLDRRRPGPRLSHAAVAFGSSMLVHGGWCEYEKGDLHRLCLTPALALTGDEGWEGLNTLDLNAQAAYMSSDGEGEDDEDDDSTYHGSEEEEEEEMEH